MKVPLVTQSEIVLSCGVSHELIEMFVLVVVGGGGVK